MKFNRLCSAFLLISVVAANFGVAAQTRRPATRTNSPAAQRCSGAWTGTVSYSRTQSMTDNKVVPRVSGRGKDTREWQMKYDYRARVSVVESPSGDGSSIGRASVSHTFSSVDKTNAEEQESCDRGKTWRTARGEFVSRSEASGSAGGLEANVTVGVNDDGTYSVSVAIPEIEGKLTGSESSTFSGQCTPKQGKTTTMPATPTRIEGNSIYTDGTHRINPSDPNRISGSYSVSNLGVTETITWNLQKCGAPLRITELRFEHMKFPNWDDWQEINEQTGTIDGNLVRIKARVLNASGETKFGEVAFKETYKGDRWDGARPDYPIKDNTVGIRLDAGEEREIEVIWDTSGFAWFDDGRPRLVQRVKAEIWENNKLGDELTRNIKIAPKPLVLVHGLWSSWRAWETWQNILTTTHSYDWKAFPVGEKPEKGRMNTGGAFLSTDPTNSIAQNARELEKYVRYAQEDRNAWHVDIVAHSMGGLISRYYIDQIMPKDAGDFRPPVARLVMLGTPNMGSPCADVMDIAFGMVGKSVEAVRQLRQEYVANFNRVITGRKGVKFSALAGNPLPTMCKTVVWNDGVVSVPSAKWTIRDTAESKSIHTDLTGTSDFSSFVKPRLAIGPRGDHNPAAPEISADRRDGEGFSFVNAAYRSEPAGLQDDSPVDFAKAVSLRPSQTLEIEIPVREAMNFGVTLMAASDVTAILVDDKGVTAGKSVAGTPESHGWFRSIFHDRPVKSGTWKLRLENTSNRDVEAVVAAWTNAGK